MKKRILAVALLLCLCLGVISCNKNADDGASTDTGNGDQSTNVTDEYITIAENKTVNYQIVYPRNANETTILAASDIFKALEKRSGGLPSMHDDFVPSSGEYDSDTLEILIGKTAYPETSKVLDKIGYGDWIICVEGNKLVITAYSERALMNAVTKFIGMLKNGVTDDGAIRLSADLSEKGTLYETANHLPDYVNGRIPEIIDSGDSVALALVNDTTLTEYDKYLAKLEALGYTYHSSNTMAENYFATYYNGDHLIHAGFYSYEKSARITIEPQTALVPLKAENAYTPNANITTSMAQIGLYNEASGYEAVGMAYVYQLADGSFLVIDGGYAPEADRLYNYMKSKAPNGEIVIASWFVTHNDGDHSGCITNFAEKYKTSVKFEQVVLNFPGSDAYFDSEKEQNSAAQVAVKALPNCRVIKAHTGQKFYIRNAVVELLYTLDSYFPQPLKIFNNSSLALTVDIEGERMLFAGDISDEVAEILVNMFDDTDYLRCDFLQLAHHGIRNSHGTNMPNTIELYQLMRPTVVLWPTSNAEYLNTNREEAYQLQLHKWNAEAADVAREVYIAGGDYATVFKLPYGLYSATRETITKN